MNCRRPSISSQTSQFIVGIAVLLFSLGCQTDTTHPWLTEPYRDPSEYRQVPHSTYAPNPMILPSIDGTATAEQADPNSDNELEQVLDELGIK